MPPSPAIIEVLQRYAAAAWATQNVGVFAPDRATPPPLTDEDVASVLDFLASTGAGAESLLVVPLGAGQECLGWLALTRGPSGAEWSETEAAVALDIGRDLGRALATARTYEREHRLVQELQDLADYKSHLVATVSHEMRTPLTAVRGFAEVLEDDPDLSPQSRSAVDAIHRGSLRLSRVVEELLVLHRNADATDLAPQSVDLVPMIEEAVALNTELAQPRGITVAVEVPAHPTRVLGVSHDLEHVVSNLVSNAVKYGRDGGRVTVGLMASGDQVVMTCADDGIGIAAADQEHLFDEFYRSPDPEALARGGTGLGLAIVRRVVERHRGRFEVESELGRGSTFRVYLPASP